MIKLAYNKEAQFDERYELSIDLTGHIMNPPEPRRKKFSNPGDALRWAQSYLELEGL